MFRVYVTTRSGSYRFPLALVSIVALAEHCDTVTLRKILTLAFLVSLLYGPLCLIATPLDGWIIGGLVVAHKPLLVRIFDYSYLNDM